TGLSPRDAALARRLAEQVVRHLRLLDLWIDHLAAPDGKKPGSRKLDGTTRDLLRLGLAQLRYSRVPVHAAVDSIMRIAPHRSRGFVNALLRRAVREPDVLDQWAAAAPPAIRYHLSDTLWAHWEKNHGEDLASRLALASVETARLAFRFNAFFSKGEPDSAPGVHAIAGHPGFFHSDEHLPDEWLAGGMVAVQDPGAALATELLDPNPGETILDACASPGGKTRHLAEIAFMKNGGGEDSARIIACDLAPRLPRLQENLRRWRVPAVECTAVDWTNPESIADIPLVHAVLLDAPCTNTGVLRRRIEARWRFDAESLACATRLQSALLDAVAAKVRPGGRLIYSTCSVEPEENEDQIAAFFERHPGWTLTTTRSSGFPDSGCDGHFAARLEYETPG
ncbi:MAG: RsmB/NOP family class I SAM-dependent RNA methyltransferase, partial [Verrucomicrobiales bacterium]